MINKGQRQAQEPRESLRLDWVVGLGDVEGFLEEVAFDRLSCDRLVELVKQRAGLSGQREQHR